MRILSNLFRGAAGFVLEESRPLSLVTGRARVAPIDYLDMLVIDVSPSMDWTDYPPSRLAAAKRASLRFLKKRVEEEPEASAGVVAFHGEASLISPPMALRSGLNDICTRIDRLTTHSATNIAAGLSLASNQMGTGSKQPRILLLTDGESNTGADPMLTARKIKAAGIQLDIIGIGGSPFEVNEKDLKQMASIVTGQLRYWFIHSVDDLVRQFESLALREVE